MKKILFILFSISFLLTNAQTTYYFKQATTCSIQMELFWRLSGSADAEAICASQVSGVSTLSVKT